MHLIVNISDLILSLWQGTIKCDILDDVQTWHWAIFHDKDAWAKHATVPGPFDHPPCNPVEKVNTHISRDKLQEAQLLLDKWEMEFKQLYYQHHCDCMHFFFTSIQKGPPVCYAQWTMEWTISNLANALKSILPFLAPPDNATMWTTRTQRWLCPPSNAGKQPYRPPAIHVALLENFAHAPLPQMHCWAQLRLPYGQIAHTAWHESKHPLEKLHIACHVKVWVILDGAICFTEVQYFTQVAIPTDNAGEWHDANIAVILVFFAPDTDLVWLSNQTVLSCKRLFFVLEHPGLNIFHFGVEEDQEDKADQQEIEAEERN
ncbi:hypothetical protein EDD22DRAFT_978923 [Suillus occidentalis]|nr:hypothetical protein EDD22DRAFT_978923 [Suillus occidentalis]